eukprot:snap_masked-scaffold_10-processed-gene-5.19-mRNA-1 protein AED:1.00 eAED:1.00 QI:0/-1/0/0/-1/1/1/0/100
MRRGKVYENDIKNRVTGTRFVKKEVKNVEITQRSEIVYQMLDNEKENEVKYLANGIDLCPFCHRYGHKETVCYAKRDLVESGKVNSRPLWKPSEEVMQAR